MRHPIFWFAVGMAGVFWISGAFGEPAKVCRGINCVPSQSQYTPYKPPTSYYYSAEHKPRQRVVEIRSRVLQINPAYTSAYSPEGFDSTTQADILSELRRLGYRLDQVAALAQARGSVVVPAAPGQPGAVVVPIPPSGSALPVKPAPKVPAAVSGLSVLNASCAACHQAGKLDPDQRFTLLDAKGALAPLTDKQKLRVLSRAYSEEMPPPNNKFGIPPLTDPEFAALVELLK